MKKIYRDDLIRSAKAARRITNKKIASSNQMSTTTVSKICNGKTNVELESLRKVAEELGFEIEIQFKKKAA